ncbi:MAG: CaiB/BaiF CoA-transferase family protein [Candidatus Hydrogenedentota bacterium]
MMRPLEDIKILDLSRVLAGPYATQILGDFGAEIIKVEMPKKGDDTRYFGPPFENNESAYFLAINRNKKSITINIKNERGIEILHRLLKISDVLVENFRPGTLDKLGLDYNSLKDKYPKLVYVSISGFGHTGPLKDKPGYDLAVQGMSGIMDITGPENGMPYKVGTSIADIIAGIYAVIGTLLALRVKEKTGKGQKVDISMLDGQVSLLTYQAGIYFMTGKSPKRKGNQHPTICPYETFETKDGYLNIAVGNDNLWISFCEIVGLEEIVNDERFKTNPQRVKNRDILFPLIQEKLKSKKRDEWLEIFDKEGLPAGPIYSVSEVLNHPQVKAREMIKELDHPAIKKMKTTGIPVKLSDTPGRILTPPPLLGEHTHSLLLSLGYSEQEIEELREQGIV